MFICVLWFFILSPGYLRWIYNLCVVVFQPVPWVLTEQTAGDDVGVLGANHVTPRPASVKVDVRRVGPATTAQFVSNPPPPSKQRHTVHRWLVNVNANINPLTAKLFNLDFYSLEVVSR